MIYVLPIMLLTFWSAQRLPPATISFLLTAEIWPDVLSGVLFLDEPFDLMQAGGAALILLAATGEVLKGLVATRADEKQRTRRIPAGQLEGAIAAVAQNHITQANHWYQRLKEGQSFEAIAAEEGSLKHWVQQVIDLAFFARKPDPERICGPTERNPKGRMKTGPETG